MITPTLHTERLTLRPATMADFEAYAAFLATDRARFMGGPHGRAKAWDWFCNDTARWVLPDMGALIVTRQGRAIGQVAVAADEGHGLATEAAAALRDWAFGTRRLDALVSYIDPANQPSVTLAQRLGGQPDPKAATPDGLPCAVYRYSSSAEVAACA